jgi:hypothetical protein
MFCRKCGHKLEAGEIMCPKCNKRTDTVLGALKEKILILLLRKREIQKLKKTAEILFCSLLLIIIAGSTLGFYLYKDQQKQTENFRAAFEGEIALTNENIKHLKECQSQLGVTKTEKDVATKEVQTQKSIVAKKSTEIKDVKTQLSGCQYYLNLAAELADVLDTQKGYYKTANTYVLKSANEILYENYTMANYYLDLASEYMDSADSYESRINSILYLFE